ncbi:phosphoglycerate mutase family protein [Lactobacillus pasteurii DSM 23907 = CRBIP 24.76]|uniref:Phosphoglycerate mutase n=1 Tax=Lactobacillus pasteurii DSM 23907 = CRBIP 24.76 TaxID=1423790 RepID=I7IYJ4_9LACO|nr:histidine phosphatase family protein [Lactobacillus pasteurii]KRK07819.1 phosphoglycerate mutase family protein [Lactobacillus pasteurii DSM 23907 = CRBIP 24.76]TDG77458.1 hypothetical protein C5L33_000901 [Lactobacillus pasteurii]CCI84532.1 Phosphoglycerate mutase [Lactobacillus pasteurii DSM 23907 = CRBIP 24.76]
MELILVRHSVSNHNTGDIISGAQSNPDLSPVGIEKVQKIYPKLDLKKIDQVFSSPLNRAVQTAKLLTNDQKEIILDQKLLEMNFGSWDGKSVTPLYDLYPDAFDCEGLITDNYLKYAKDAESFQDVIDRVQSFYDNLKANYKGKTVMIVCHGFTIRAFIAALLQVDIDKIGTVDNISFTEFNIDDQSDRVQMKGFNQKLPIYYGI